MVVSDFQCVLEFGLTLVVEEMLEDLMTLKWVVIGCRGLMTFELLNQI